MQIKTTNPTPTDKASKDKFAKKIVPIKAPKPPPKAKRNVRFNGSKDFL